MTTESSTAELNLFLSSTVRDFGNYRRAIRDACHHKAETTCLLSEEDWSGGYDDTVAKCEQRVRGANAFLLLIGYWYGSVPPQSERSITHIEFEIAMAKWGTVKFPPIAVMMPEPGSSADKTLRKAAQTILKAGKVSADAHEKSLGAFVSAVTGSWRTVTRFKHTPDLREHVIARCWQWKGRTPIAVARGEIAVNQQLPVPQVTDEQLGSLGRKPQFDAAQKAIAMLADYPDVPAMAMIVYGNDDAGQRMFLERLINTALRRYYPRRRISNLPVKCNTKTLLAWVAQSLGVHHGTAVQTPEQLAEHVAAELKQQPLYFILDRIGDLPGGITSFHNEFWVPFFNALGEFRAKQQFSHRLIAVVSDYSGKNSDWKAITYDDPVSKGSLPDCTKLFRIPYLDEFNRNDILAWFDEMNVPDDPAGHRAALADRALRDSEGVPLRVFERLRGETLWPAGELP